MVLRMQSLFEPVLWYRAYLGPSSCRIGRLAKGSDLILSYASQVHLASRDSAEGDNKPQVKALIVAGSINMDLVLSVDRLPAAGETISARSLETFPGGKARSRTVLPVWLGSIAIVGYC